MEVAAAKRCLDCRGKLASDNENALCGPCLTRWRRERPRELPPQTREERGRRRGGPKGSTPVFPDLLETCEKGHVYQVVGRTRYARCYECGQRLADKNRPSVRYFHLPGFKDWLGDTTLRELADASGVERDALGAYLYKGKRAPEQTARVIAVALGCSLDDLKWGGRKEG